MRRAKCLVAVVGMAFAIAASMSTQVFAATSGWMVNGTKLTGTAAISTTASVHEPFILDFSGEEIRCSGEDLSLAKPVINGASGMSDVESLGLRKCHGNSICPLATGMNEEIKTLPVLADLTLDGTPGTKGRFLATNTSKLLATIDFEGAECSFAGPSGIFGALAFLAPTGRSESTLQSINLVTEVAGELRLGPIPATLDGSFLLRLANSGSFSFL